MEIKRLRCLALEIFKTTNNLNPCNMKEIFSITTNLTHRPLDINFNQNNTRKYGSNSLRSLGGVLKFEILCLAKSKRKRSIINLRII